MSGVRASMASGLSFVALEVELVKVGGVSFSHWLLELGFNSVLAVDVAASFPDFTDGATSLVGLVSIHVDVHEGWVLSDRHTIWVLLRWLVRSWRERVALSLQSNR